jgi:predicted PurR-regulated permease PerM
MDGILHLSTGWLIVGAVVIPFLFAALLFWVSMRSPIASWCEGFGGLVAPFFASVSLIFAVFAAFLGNDIWQRVETSNASLEREFSAAQSIAHIATALGEDDEAVLSDVKRYAQVTIDQELSVAGRERSTDADQALQSLIRSILVLNSGRTDVAAAQSAMLVEYEDIWNARGVRRQIATTHSDPEKWLAVVILGLLTQAALALNHVGKPQPLAAALSVFTLAFVTVLVTLLLHERPLLAPALETLQQRHGITDTGAPDSS